VSAAIIQNPSAAARLRRVIAIVLVFMIVGPPVGAMAFMLSAALIGMGKSVDLAGLTWVGLFALIYAAPLSYLIGTGPAAAVGLLVGVRQAYFGAIQWPLAVAIGIAAGAAFLLLSGQPLRAGGETDDAAHLPVIVVTCLSGTLVCWAIVRKWYFERTRVAEARA
jgi:hypothetical protein